MPASGGGGNGEAGGADPEVPAPEVPSPDQVVPVSDAEEPHEPSEPGEPEPAPLEEAGEVDPMEIATQAPADVEDVAEEVLDEELEQNEEAKIPQLARGKSHVFYSNENDLDSQILPDSQGSPTRFDLAADSEQFTVEDKKLPFEPVATEEPETEAKIAEMETELKKLRLEKAQIAAHKRIKIQSAFPGGVVHVEESLPFGADTTETMEMPESAVENLMEKFNTASIEVQKGPATTPIATRQHLKFVFWILLRMILPIHLPFLYQHLPLLPPFHLPSHLLAHLPLRIYSCPS